VKIKSVQLFQFRSFFSFHHPIAQAFLFMFALAFGLQTENAIAQTKLGPFELAERSENPLRPPLYFSTRPNPILFDLDEDGDNDLIVGSQAQGYGTAIRYYRNDGPPSAPVFTELTSVANPFYYKIYNYSTPYSYIVPTLGDLDGDGDADLLVGFSSGEIRYYRNNGELEFQSQTGAWDPVTKSGNPFHGTTAGYFSRPHLTDIDKDGDLDVLLATQLSSTYNTSVHLYINDGLANFTRQDIPGVNPDGNDITATTYDYNKDGDVDIITGSQSGFLRYFENSGDGTFAEQSPWADLNDLAIGTYVFPAFGDLSGDGLTDVIIGSTPSSGYQTITVYYNTGDNIYEKQTGPHSPFGGFDVGNDASPFFTDVDGDGVSDFVSGNNANYITYYRNDNGVFQSVPAAENPFAGVVTGDNFCLSYIDLNGDGLKDIVGASGQTIQYFRNTESGFTLVPLNEGPFANITTLAEAKSGFGDLDGDGDYDLILSDEIADDNTTTAYEYGFRIRFFLNTGSSTSAVFTEKFGSENPFSAVWEEYALYPRVADIDNDGDVDALIGEGGALHIETPESNEFLYFENKGTSFVLNFVYRGNVIPQYDNIEYFNPAFLDYDNDGDLDIFEGEWGGTIYFYKNTNPTPVLSLKSSPYVVSTSSGSVFVDDLMTLTDPDNDSINQVIVQISNFNSTDNLTFAIPVPNTSESLNSSFNPTTGELVITGKAPVSFYQALLRSLKYTFNEGTTISSSSGRARVAPSATALAVSEKIITFRVYDSDFTTPSSYSRAITITSGVNQPPAIAPHSITGTAGKVISQNVLGLLSDPDGSADLNFSTLKIKAQPSSGALATISSAGDLTINYSLLPFTGNESVKIEICDVDGACTENAISLDITNSAPQFSDASIGAVAGNSVAIDLLGKISDPDGNEVISTIQVVQAGSSNAPYTLDSNGALSVNYSSLPFTGTDHFIVRICDITGACDEGEISISVQNTSPAFSSGNASILFGQTATIDLLPLMSDADNNLRFSTLKVTGTSSSGATVVINASNQLTADYSQTSFFGADAITVEICDVALACATATVTINVVNTAPVLTGSGLELNYGASRTLDLRPLVSDAESNVDLTSLRVVAGPASGAIAEVENGIVRFDYADVVFAGKESIVVEVCDLAGMCSQASIEVTVRNGSPVIQAAPIETKAGSAVTLDLTVITSDPDNNLDNGSYEVVDVFSNATARIINGTLELDYRGTNFSGTDQVTVRVCDVAGACTDQVILVEVNAPRQEDVQVFNAVAPNGSGDNKWMRIVNLPSSANKVTVFNRWGDLVFETTGYDNDDPSKRFEGRNAHGNELPSGTYFYKVEFADPSFKMMSGYLTLKQ
jgi:gliding motility-associated-like protein